MKIIFIALKGYKRLALNNIQYLSIEPKSKVQLILGRNGVGKSSVLKELTALPANPADFEKDGYKHIRLEHHNSLYDLKSMFTATGNKFSFEKDGVELNPGGTTSTYKELVRKEFGLTQDIHELMIGDAKFTAMSVADRRNWFMRISAADYTYAIQYYMRLKEYLRDIQGGIKLNQARMVQETEKLLKPEEEQLERDNITKLNSLLSSMLELKSPIQVSKDQVLAQLTNIDTKLTSLSNTLFTQRAKIPTSTYVSAAIPDIDRQIIDTKSTIQSQDHIASQLHNEIEKQQKAHDALNKSSSATFSNVDTTIDEIVLAISSIKSMLHFPFIFTSARDALQALSSIHEPLTEIFTSIQPNEDKLYSREYYINALEAHKTQANLVSTLDQTLTALIAKKKDLEHFKEHNKLECPNCQHVWYKGYDANTYTDTISSIASIDAKLTQAKQTLSTQATQIEAIKIYLEQYRSYLSISKAWSILNPFWDYLISTNTIFSNPRKVRSLIDDLKADLKLHIQIEELNKKHIDTLAIKELLSKNQSLSLESITTSLTELNQKLTSITRSQMALKAHLQTLHVYKQASQDVTSLSIEVSSLLSDREDTISQLSQLLRRDALNASIQAVQLEISKREQLISRIDIQKALIANITLQISDLTARQDVLKIAVRELSPSEGLIAKGLIGFINHFTYKLNSFIKKIWLYPLELVPVSLDETDSVDLDYKFQVRINDSTIIPDVSKASSAMKEVIDLAFRIVSMQYLGMQDAPLYSDEFGASFDKDHRESAFRMVQELTVNSNFSQIFMISHYEEMYGCFKNTDITSLSEANTPLASGSAFNANTIIK